MGTGTLEEAGRLTANPSPATCWRWVSGLDEMDLALARCDSGHVPADRCGSCDTVPRAAAVTGSSFQAFDGACEQTAERKARVGNLGCPQCHRWSKSF
jgi:hypothetical protein